jgi:ATP-dependent Clp protease ATP-binding subunit ClpA
LELGALLADRNVTIRVTDGARSVLAEKGYDPQMGARPLARVIEEEVKTKLTDAILFGALEHGGEALVDAEPAVGTELGKLVFNFTAAPPQDADKPS